MNHTQKILLVLLLGLSLSSCGDKNKKTNTQPSTKEEGASTEQITNTETKPLDETSSTLSERNQKDSPLAWQTWGPDVLKAAQERDLMVCLTLVGKIPNSEQVSLGKWANNPALVKQLHQFAIPALASVDQYPELAQLAFFLSTENATPLNFPFVILLTPEGDIFSHLPIIETDSENNHLNLEVFINTSASIWEKDSAYRKEFAAEQSQKRFSKIKEAFGNVKKLELTSLEALQSKVGEFISLYDESTQSFDGSGGALSPEMLSLLNKISRAHSYPDYIKKKSNFIFEDMLTAILKSPIHDPLEEFFYSGKTGSGWTLPNLQFSPNLNLLMTDTIIQRALTSGEEKWKKLGIEQLKHNENLYIKDHSLVSKTHYSQLNRKALIDTFYYDYLQISQLLSAEEMALATNIFNLKPRGNIPLVNDTAQTFFRLNTIASTKSPKQAAQELKISEEKATSLYQSVIQKLKQHRHQKLKETGLLPFSRLRDSAILASLYSKIWIATGDSAYLKKAENIIQKIQQSLITPERIFIGWSSGNALDSSARTEDLAYLALAALDLHSYTGSQDYLNLAHSVAKYANDFHILDGDILDEVHTQDRLVKAPISIDIMIYGPSSLALFNKVNHRLALANQAKGLEKLLEVCPPVLPKVHSSQTILVMDRIESSLIKLTNLSIEFRTPEPKSQKSVEILRQLYSKLPTDALISVAKSQSGNQAFALTLGDAPTRELPSIEALLTALASDKSR